VDGINLISLKPNGDNTFAIATCPLQPETKLDTSKGPCETFDQTFNTSVEQAAGGFVDRGLVVLQQGLGLFTPTTRGQSMEWQLIDKGPLGGTGWTGLVIARNLDIRNSTYWIAGLDSGGTSKVVKFYSNTGMDRGVEASTLEGTYLYGAAHGSDVVFLVDKDQTKYLLVNKQIIDASGGTVLSMASTTTVNAGINPHTLDWLDTLRADSSTVCYTVFSAATSELHCIGYSIEDKTWNPQDQIIGMIFPSNSYLVSPLDAMISIQPSRSGGYLVFVASTWKNSNSYQTLRLSIFKFRDVDASASNLFDSVQIKVSTTKTTQSIDLRDVYFDRLAKTFMVTGMIKGDSPKSFFMQFRHVQ
jgi:hypothetical protein